ncbi:GntR family transcriptional regulator [Nonomuraea cavernae]|uniref:GntR family transcriptional regulator n=1 Tax=Nonomuraea cavernae TaxID=2045107 RepID=A0A917YRT6_9ACTN|nr:GntR family transcriptional regulator [Nonomuraea cavernae]MCA2184613.1 GntR family transcriptional regulator [Nonomuraea cavernae]GGO63266.1 GntR family transcriptional regulator [Nonomuraea cavernae]
MTTRRDEIANHLRDLITSGTYAPGDVLPNQTSMKATYQTTSNTISAAVKILRDEGLIWRVANRGLIVQDTRPLYIDLSMATTPSNGLGPWETACHNVGRTGSMQLVSVDRGPAEAEVARALQLSVGATVVRRDRRALVDGQAVMLDTGYYPLALVDDTPVAGSGKVGGGTLAALIAAGVLDPQTTRVRERIGARAATKDEAETLRLRPGVSVLTAERVTRDGEAQPVELLQRVANARRIRFQTDDLSLRNLGQP